MSETAFTPQIEAIGLEPNLQILPITVLREGHIPDSRIKVAKDLRHDLKYILLPRNGLEQTQVHQTIDLEVQAINLGNYLDMPVVAQAQEVSKDGISYIAQTYIEDAIELGPETKLSEQSVKYNEQQTALAKGALYQAILDLGADNNQYLIDPKTQKIYLSDITLPNNFDTNIDTYQTPKYFLQKEHPLYKEQIGGLTTAAFFETLEKLDNLEPVDIQWAFEDNIQVAEKFTQRIKNTAKIFRDLAHSTF